MLDFPSVVDLSFDFGGIRTEFIIIKFGNIDGVIISNIGKIGQVIQVIFPPAIIASALHPVHNIDYDTKVLLGPALGDFELLLNRFVRILVEHNKRRSFLFALGLEHFDVDYARRIVQKFEEFMEIFVDHRSGHEIFLPWQLRQFSSVGECEKNVFLPKTSFKKFIKSRERSRLDLQLSYDANFEGFYDWQLRDPTRQSYPIFELLDGPPYANGEAHVGHAINKIFKDFIIRSQIYAGKRVLFRPGWDCHGLPIELKIAKESHDKSTPVEIRNAAQKIALHAIAMQKNSFKRWAVTADWSNPYYTMDNEYVSKQLKIFGELYKRKIIRRAFMPVYWSPSSFTALAESELEYKEYTSVATFFRYVVINSETILAKCEADVRPTKLYALIWTTTPWTLPINNAIAYNKKYVYVVVELLGREHHRRPIRHLYILAKDLLGNLEKEMSISSRIMCSFMGEELEGLMYRSAMFNELALPFIEAKHVTVAVGTGLVHTSYAHGFDDFMLAVKLGEKVRCFVDERGCYTRDLGHDLEGKNVLKEGADTVLKLFKKNIVHTSMYEHQYPHDWRTKQPVIIRSSAQWFIDVSQIGLEAARTIERDVPQIGNTRSDKREGLLKHLKNRSVWCISRQRCWGTPIPIFYREDGNVIVAEDVIDAVADCINKNGAGVWWQYSADQLFPKELRKKYGIGDKENLEKSRDVLDVWMDSGVAWAAARDRTEPVDVLVEGLDQFRGWFQSLTLTSYALNNKLPYKRIFVHAFAVDENEQKMSKSVGNVVKPELITDGSLNAEPLGADGLRLWVAQYGCDGDKARIGPSVIDEIKRNYNQLRSSFWYLLGTVNGYKKTTNQCKHFYIDRYILQQLAEFTKRCLYNCNEYRFALMINEYLQFLQHPLNSPYISSIKNRLYCGTYMQRQSAQETLAKIGLNLAALLAPILPHLVAEIFMYHPCVDDPTTALRECNQFYCSDDLNPAEMYSVMDAALNVRAKIIDQCRGKDFSRMGFLLKLSKATHQKLYPLQAELCSYHSELVEITGVSMVRIECDEKVEEIEVFPVSCEREFCKRCRRNTRPKSMEYCERCTNSMAEFEMFSEMNVAANN